jgi:hypothetical protein
MSAKAFAAGLCYNANSSYIWVINLETSYGILWIRGKVMGRQVMWSVWQIPMEGPNTNT